MIGEELRGPNAQSAFIINSSSVTRLAGPAASGVAGRPRAIASIRPRHAITALGNIAAKDAIGNRHLRIRFDKNRAAIGALAGRKCHAIERKTCGR